MSASSFAVIKGAQNDSNDVISALFDEEEESAHPMENCEGDKTTDDLMNRKERSQATVTFVQQEKAASANNKSKNRKSATDLQEAPQMKKLRKSQRLENKRLAKQMKPKIDQRQFETKDSDSLIS